MKIKLIDARLSFPQLWRPTQVNNEGEPAYSAAFLLAADDEQVDFINNVIDQVALAKWEHKAKPILAQLRGAGKVCLQNGDLKAEREGYAGNWFINARSKTKPLVLDQNRVVLAEGNGRPYGGCYVDAVLEIWAQDNQWGKRVNASLKGVQFRRNGDAFAGGPPADPNDFDDISDTGAESDLA